MPSAQLQTIFSGAGISISSTISKEASGGTTIEKTLAAAPAGSLTTREPGAGGDDTGVVTLSEGHGVITGKVDVYWADGLRYGMDATRDGNSVTIDGGEGDVLPAQSTAVIVQNQDQLDIGFDGDAAVLIVAYCRKRGHMDFQDSAGNSRFAHEFAAGECWTWYDGSGIERPITGNPVAKVMASNGDSTSSNKVVVGALYDA